MVHMLLRHIMSARYDSLRIYTKTFCGWHCQNSGRCVENSELLEEISQVADSREGDFINWDAVFDILRWLQVDINGLEPTSNRGSVAYAHDLQYRLFKKKFKVVHEWGPPVIIFTPYEAIDLGKLMNGKYTYGPHLFIKYFPSLREEGFFWCWVFGGDLESYPERNTVDQFHDTIDPLMRRLLREPGSLKKYPISIDKGGQMMVRKCLSILSEGYPPHHGEPMEYSYARKYWAKHLSQVSFGNDAMSHFLKWFDFSKIRHELSPGDIEELQTWLTWSNVTLRYPLDAEPRSKRRRRHSLRNFMMCFLLLLIFLSVALFMPQKGGMCALKDTCVKYFAFVGCSLL
ncbi:hypothetical protein BDZ94DRAFT_1265570 [Collybia nuda]|uniref:Uncharacterized protein n=1 Tax=Collybia nuda TaxID=64659 RepID=A0A9P6CCH5_9AGAR|nr:hypothetical protein BDZ94DRAFT_1265570 [Collybia nuda]